jgi:hypothetical protein
MGPLDCRLCASADRLGSAFFISFNHPSQPCVLLNAARLWRREMLARHDLPMQHTQAKLSEGTQ